MSRIFEGMELIDINHPFNGPIATLLCWSGDNVFVRFHGQYGKNLEGAMIDTFTWEAIEENFSVFRDEIDRVRPKKNIKGGF